MKTKNNLRTKPSTLSGKMKVFIVSVLSVLFALVGFAGFLYFQSSKPWYTAYKGPIILLEQNGETSKVPLATLALLSSSLKHMLDDPALKDVALPVKDKVMKYAELLASTYPTAEGVHVDFVAMLHPSMFGGHPDYQAAIKESQDAVYTFLENGKYDIFGREGSWFNPLDFESLIAENHYGMKLMGVPLTDENKQILRSALTKELDVNGTMRYVHTHQDAVAMGIEDRELFYLHDKVKELMLGGSAEQKLTYPDHDRVLVWFRTEVALAKLLQQMQKQGLKRGVFVMGQSHRYQFEVLAEQLGLSGTIHHTVPERYRGDEES